MADVVPFIGLAGEPAGLEGTGREPGLEILPDLEEDVEEPGRTSPEVGVVASLPPEVVRDVHIGVNLCHVGIDHSPIVVQGERKLLTVSESIVGL